MIRAAIIALTLVAPTATVEAPKEPPTMPPEMFGQWCLTAHGQGDKPSVYEMIGACHDKRDMMIIVSDGTYDAWGQKCVLREITKRFHVSNPIYHATLSCKAMGIAFTVDEMLQLTGRSALLSWTKE